MYDTERLKRTRAAVADCKAEIDTLKAQLEDAYGRLWNAHADMREATDAVIQEIAAAEAEIE